MNDVSNESHAAGPAMIGAQQAASSLAIPIYNANQLNLALMLHEISVTFGRARQMIDPVTGMPSSMASLEWLLTISMPPTAAAALSAALQQAIAAYESQFGKIPSESSAPATV
jgi:hypothetical protein